jgi:hypothetical protein
VKRSMNKMIGLASLLVLAACNPRQPGLGETSSAQFTNGGFETGAAGAVPPPPWVVSSFLNNGITVQTPQTRAGLDLAAGGKGLTTIINSPGGPLSQSDPDLGAAATLRWPRFGNQAARVNFHSSTAFTTGGSNNGQNVNSMAQTMTIGPGDVDPTDSQVHVRFVVAPVLQNPAHAAAQQPYYFIQLTNLTQGNTILYQDFNLSGAAGIPWKTINGGTTNEIDYTDWQLVDIAPGAAKLAQGDQVMLEVIASGCSPGGHFGEIYVDGVGSTLPGLFVSGTGPTQANACSNITYTLKYENGDVVPATGVSVTFNTPPNTTFQSVAAPGLACTTPAVGVAGAVVCTVGNLAAGASGSFQVTVNISCAATGILTAGNYWVQGTGITPLLGPHINTTIGCSADAQCPAGDWCAEALSTCTPTLANGTPVPVDLPHTGPTLNGICTAAAGTLVCTSTVCDTRDNDCGYLNGDGPCTAVTGGVVCRSAVCDPDGKCGFANGDGPCTVATGPVVCRSGVCSTNGKCEPAGGCNVDADCTGGNWCDESTHTCTPKLGNGVQVPTDPPHTAPTLDGTCTAAAGTLVCVSAVCDTKDNDCGYLNGDGPCTIVTGPVVCRSAVCDPDGNCGYANGDGPCTIVTGPVVCRSGTCSVGGKCEPAGGCNVDADCTGGNWCDESTHTCTPKLGNGVQIPTDPPHSGPTLDGTCTVAAGTLVCISGVCDTKDNECGFANGDGPCTIVTGPVVCRSGACSINGTCEPLSGCNVDADCTGGNWCDESMHLCTPPLANGVSMPSDPPHTLPTLDGTCTVAAGTLVCASAVCDTKDNKCGYADGDGPCTALDGGVVCRSGLCSSNGTCQAVGGCNVDADCTGGDWCDESTHTCTAPLANGTAIPNDPPHTGPTLDGMCTPDAGTLVCLSGVCDTKDNECGYANGDGPCTLGTGGVVCRSGLCSSNGTCQAVGGCNVDADCTGGDWCDETTHVCTAPLANGTAVPSDPPHSDPTLDGTCTVAAGMLVCASAVCDTKDNECGYANGDGPCDNANGDVVCRSGKCGASGTCEASGTCSVDADCTDASLPVCDTTTHQCVASRMDAFSGGGFCTLAAAGTPSGHSLLAGLALVLLILGFRAARPERSALVRPRA